MDVGSAARATFKSLDKTELDENPNHDKIATNNVMTLKKDLFIFLPFS